MPRRALAAFAFLLAAQAAAQTGPIGERIRSTRQSLSEHPISGPGLGDIGTGIENLLKSADLALQAGRPYLSLEKLGQATGNYEGARFVAGKSDTVKTMADFEAEWAKTQSTLAIPVHDWSAAPAALRALSESAGVRAVPLLEGARGFATATGPRDGLFYLGQARGEADFARFCAALKLPRKGRAVRLRSLLPDLLALQEKVNAAFQPPRSIDQHARFIALNSTIKLARELDAAQLYAGALYQYLEAVRHLAMLDAAAPDPDTVKQSLRRLGATVDGAAQDDSIAAMFLQRAVAQIEGTDDEKKSAAVIAGAVVPAYYAALKPAAGAPRTPAKSVRLTLVRWPYT